MSNNPKMAYEGASRGRRFLGWLTGNTSANTEVYSAGNALRDRMRDLVRNNPYARRAVEVIETNTISTGIIYQSSNPTLEKLAQKYFETTQVDADGRHDLYGLQALVCRAVVETGECLVRRRLRKSSDDLTVPMQIQVLEADFLDTSKNQELNNGGKVIQGIQFNAFGKREGYWLYNSHPGDNFSFRMSSKFVPAEDILHIYRMDRPGQVRGVPWGTSAIVRMRDFDDYQDAHRVRQKIAACFAAFRKKISTNTFNEDNEVPNPSDFLEPGMISELPIDEDIVFANPPGVEGYGEYTTTELHAIAIGFGIPFFSLTGDLSKVNYSSGRMGWLDFQRNIKKWQEQIFIKQFCDPVWNWFIEAANLIGATTDNTKVIWTPPRREMIDPAKESGALRDQIRAGLISHSEALRQLGYDPETVFKELAADRKRLAELGVATDSDPGFMESIKNKNINTVNDEELEPDDE